MFMTSLEDWDLIVLQFSGFVLPATADIREFFYLSISLLAITLVYLVFICPESREPSAQPLSALSVNDTTFKSDPFLVIRQYANKFFTAVLIPIAMFAPHSLPGKPNKKNYNITLLGLGLFLYVISTVSSSFFSKVVPDFSFQGVYTSKYLYAQHVYEWTATQVLMSRLA